MRLINLLGSVALQFLAALLRRFQRRRGPSEIGLIVGILQLSQHVALCHALTFHHVQLQNHPADLRTDQHLLGGNDVALGFQGQSALARRRWRGRRTHGHDRFRIGSGSGHLLAVGRPLHVTGRCRDRGTNGQQHPHPIRPAAAACGWRLRDAQRLHALSQRVAVAGSGPFGTRKRIRGGCGLHVNPAGQGLS